MSQQFEFEDIDNDEFNDAFDDAFDDEDAGSWTDDSNCFPDDIPQEDQENIPNEVTIENEYFTAYYSIREDPINARKVFEQVIALCDDYNENNAIDTVLEYRFKALTQTVKLLLNSNNDQDSNDNTAKQYYQQLLTSIDTVNPSEMQSAIMSILSICDNRSKVKNAVSTMDLDISDLFYETTLMTLRKNGKYALWFKIGMNRCNNLMSHEKNMEKEMLIQKFKKCKDLIDGIHDFVLQHKKDEQQSDLLQVYCIKIDLIMNAMDYNIDGVGGKNEMLNLIDLCKTIMENNIAIIDVGSTAIINECLAKYVYYGSDDWNMCHSHFQDSFISYSSLAVKEKRTISNLKYLLIAYCMLQCDESSNNNNNNVCNPFSMNEVCVYERNPLILNMKSLVNALECNDINAFNRYCNIELKTCKQSNVNGDPFLFECLKKLKYEFQGKVLINISKSYTRMKLKWLSNELEMTISDIEQLVVKLIMNQRIYGKLDQVKQVLIMDKYVVLDGGNGYGKGNALVQNMNAWMTKVNEIKNSICSKNMNRFNNRNYGAFGDNDDFLSRSMMDEYYDDEFLLSRPFVFAN